MAPGNTLTGIAVKVKGDNFSRFRLASQTFACYNHSYIKRGLTRPANLQLVQGGFLERGMWPKGNIECQPSTDNPLEGFVCLLIPLNSIAESF